MRNLRWQIDEIGRGRIRGWALDTKAPRQRPVLDILLDGRFVGQALANHWRSDLRDAGIGDGFHGFEWRDPRLEASEANQHIAVEWPLCGCWGTAKPAKPGCMGLRTFRSATAYLRERLSQLPQQSSRRKLPPLPASSPAFAPLLAPACGEAPARGSGRAISAYQSYVLHRFRKEPDFDPAFTLGEYRRFLRWYIREYGAVRANLRIPLSAVDIAFLNGPLADDPERLEVMAMFASDFATRAGLEAQDWRFYNAPSLGIADCVPALTIPDGTLRAEAFAQQHPILAKLDLAKAEVKAGVARVLNALQPEAAAQAASGLRVESAIRPILNAKMVDVQIIGPFSKALGVGESCRRMARALEMTGLAIRTCDFSIDYPNEALTDLPFTLEEPGPATINIIHLNLEEIPKVMAYWPDVFSGATNIAVPYLELSQPAPEQQLGLALVDRVFAATEHIKAVIGDNVPIDVVGSAVELSPPRDRLGARRQTLKGLCSDSDFVVLVSGDALSGLDRKNLMGSVRAFLTAFPDEPDRKLLIKTHSVNRTQDRRSLRIWSDICEVAAADPRVILLDKHLDKESYQALQAACDVYLSLHRAEGLGYHVLECMQLGIPCVVTDYSGTRDFSSDETAFPVTYDLVSVRPWEYPFSRGEQLWAEPRLDVAVQHLRMLANLPAKGLEVGLRARQFIHVAYSLPAFARCLDALLRPIISGAGSS